MRDGKQNMVDEKNKETIMTYSDLIKAAKTLDDLGLKDVDKSASETTLSKNKNIFEQNTRDLSSIENKRYIG